MSVKIIHADCLDAMRGMADASVDSVVTDPPYHLTSIVKRYSRSTPEDIGRNASATINGQGTNPYHRAASGFMGKQWDGGDIAFRVELWAEVCRVLKPGGHLVSFGGTRTYHRMACAIEDAGFEIRDQLSWIYGSGFSKVGMLKKRHQELWCKCDGEQATKRDLRPMRNADVSAAEHSVDQRGQVLFAGMPQQNTSEYGTARAKSESGDGEQPGLEGRSVCGAGQGLRDGTEPGASEGSGERLRVRAHPGGRGDVGSSAAAGRGGASHQRGSVGQPTGELEGIRLASGALGNGAHGNGSCCPRCGGISRAFDGFGGSLKPAHEPICLARKPLIGAVAQNVAKYGTGALNIDGCRVETGDNLNGGAYSGSTRQRDEYISTDAADGAVPLSRFNRGIGDYEQPAGRWPANVCHDGSPEVLEAFARFGERASTGDRPSASTSDGEQTVYSRGLGRQGQLYADTGTAARFFFSAKASREEREIGCEGLKAVEMHRYESEQGQGPLPQQTPRKPVAQRNTHPTVKPIALMQWLCRLVTPPGGTVLDPFSGSGSTGIAADREGFNAILIEREAEYVEIMRRRVSGDAPLFFGTVA